MANKKASGRMDYDLDMLNDSISMNMADDSFEYGNDTTFVLPSKPTQPSSSSSSRQTKGVLRSQRQIGEDAQNARSWIPQEDEEEPDNRSPMSRELARNLRLEKERDWLRDINKLLLKSADEMDKFKDKLENVQSATQTSHELLDLYSRILTQTEHTKNLLSNPDWKGVTAETERESQIREQERIRLARERELEQAEELERQRKQQEAEAAAERNRQQSQLSKSTRGGSAIPTKYSRGRGTSAGTTAGRTMRGKSRIGRITR